MKRIKCNSGEFDIDLELRGRCTVICVDSTIGNFLYENLKDADNLVDVYMEDYNSVKNIENYNAAVEYVNTHRDKIVVINQIDAIQELNDELMYAINTDYDRNTYIAIGRAPALTYDMSDVAEISIINNKITLNYICPEPIMV